MQLFKLGRIKLIENKGKYHLKGYLYKPFNNNQITLLGNLGEVLANYFCWAVNNHPSKSHANRIFKLDSIFLTKKANRIQGNSPVEKMQTSGSVLPFM